MHLLIGNAIKNKKCRATSTGHEDTPISNSNKGIKIKNNLLFLLYVYDNDIEFTEISKIE